MFEFKLPDVGEGLHEAELLEWVVKVGDTIAEGDTVAEVSTDKVNVELPSPCSGIVTEMPWSPGDIIEVGQVLMRIDDGKGGAAEREPKAAESRAAGAPKTAGPAERRRVKAGPVVRRYAAQHDVDLGLVVPSGDGGQVTREDVDRYLAGTPSEAPTEDRIGVTRVKLSGPRLAAAQKLEASARTLATSTITFEVNADALLEALARTKEKAAAQSIKVSPLAVIARCVCHALSKHPNFNAAIDEEDRALEVYDAIHLGTAVDTPDGLVVPVIRDAGEKTVLEIARDIAETAERARTGELAVAEFRGSTFTLSSTGGLERATMTGTTPVINLPNVATLWFSRISDRPRVIAGALNAGPVMAGTLSFDHRFLHGADGMAFINTLDDTFGNPSSAL